MAKSWREIVTGTALAVASLRGGELRAEPPASPAPRIIHKVESPKDAPEAIPDDVSKLIADLRTVLEYHDVSNDEKAARDASIAQFLEQLDNDDPDKQNEAREALKKLGRDAQDALRKTSIEADIVVRSNAKNALEKILKEKHRTPEGTQLARTEFNDALTPLDPVRIALANKIFENALKIENPTPETIENAKTNVGDALAINPQIVSVAAALLADLDKVADKQALALVDLVNELGKRGKDAKAANFILMEIASIKNDTPTKKAAIIAAIDALGETGYGDKEVVQKVISLTKPVDGKQPDPDILMRSLVTLGKTGSGLKWGERVCLVPDLTGFLKHQNPAIRQQIAIVFGEFGEGASPATVPLLDAINSETVNDKDNKHPEVKRAYFSALAKIGSRAQIAVPWFKAEIYDKDETLQLIAINGLKNFGPAAAEALPNLKEIAGDTKQSAAVQNAARKAAADIEALPKEKGR